MLSSFVCALLNLYIVNVLNSSLLDLIFLIYIILKLGYDLQSNFIVFWNKTFSIRILVLK